MSTGTYVPTTLASGSTAPNQTAINAMTHAEEGLPSGTRMSMNLSFKPLTIPITGGHIDIGQWVSDAVNGAYHAGKFVSQQMMPGLWPGESQIATYDSGSQTVTLKWLSGGATVAFSAVIILFLVGLTITDVIDPITLIAGIIIIEWLTHWALLKWLLHEAANTSVMGLSILDWIAIGGGVFLLGLLSRHNSS